jgi:hypothetical protein
MTATASYNDATRVLTISADGLPSPVAAGTFPNQYNPNTITEQDFDHDFLYRGGTFGISRTFDSNTWTQVGFIRSIDITLADNALFGAASSIRSGDHLLFVFSDGIKRKFLFTGTSFTSIAGQCWLATDNRLDLIMSTQDSSTGTYEYYDQRNGRLEKPLGAIGIAANGVVFFNPSAGAGRNPPLGFSWNVQFDDLPVNFGGDTCGGYPEQTGQYRYDSGDFLNCWRSNNSMGGYNDYYGSSQYNGDILRHPDGHSKIVGYSFDGFPIYGPFGYDDVWNNLSGTRIITTSYEVRDIEVSGRPEYGSTDQNPPAGSLIEDWQYIEGLGDLDVHNGRFCVTPEYPNGTYAYFISVDPSDINNPVFPYMMGTSSRETINVPINSGANPVQPPPSGGGEEEQVRPTLQFTLQPQNATANVGEIATFTVQSQILPEDGPIGYQWYRSTDGGFAFAAITGATSNTYSTTALAFMTGYRYRCRITGPLGVALDRRATNSPLDSNVVVLTVAGSGGLGNLQNRFDSTLSTLDSTSQRYDGT